MAGPPAPNLPAPPDEGFGAFEDEAAEHPAAAEEPAERRATSQGPQQPVSGGGVAFTDLFLASKDEYRKMVG